MSKHWVDQLFEARPDHEYDEWPHGDNVHVRRLANAKRCLSEIRFTDTAIDTERRALLTEIESIRATLAETHVSLVVAGDWNAGKSTLINAFLGERWMPMNVNRETVTVNRLMDGEHRYLKVFLHGQPYSQPLINKYQNAQHAHQMIQDRGRRERGAIERIDILYPGHPFLKYCAIIDTPGLDFSQEDSVVSQPLIDDADVLVWVMHYEGPREQDHQALRTFRQRNPGSRILAVVNYADLVDDAEYDEVFADKHERLKQDADAIFFVSARRDLELRDSDPGFRQLRVYLNERILPAYGELKYRRPTRFASNLLAQFHAFAEKYRSQPLEPLSERIMNLQPEMQRLINEFYQKVKDLKIQRDDSALDVSHKLRQSFVAMLDHVRGLLALDASQFGHSGESRDAQKLSNLSLEIANGRVKLGVFGSLSAGKSTFINTLIRSDSMLPVDEDRCTSVFTRVRQADADHPAQTLEIDWKPLNQLMDDLSGHLMTLGIQLPDEMISYCEAKRDQTLSTKHLPHVERLLQDVQDIKRRELKEKSSRSAHEQALALLSGLGKLEELRSNHRTPDFRGSRIGQNINSSFSRRHIDERVSTEHESSQSIRYDSERYRQLMRDESVAILIRQIVYYQDHELLKYMEIFDSPGAGSRSQRHSDLSKNLLEQADAVCFITEGATPLERSEEMDFLEHAREAGCLKGQRASGFFVVANKIDLSKKSPERIRSEIQRKVEEEFQGELKIPDENIHTISCKTKDGLDDIQRKINQFLNYEKDCMFLERCWESVDNSLNKVSALMAAQISDLQQDIAEHEERLLNFSRSKDDYLKRFDEILTQDCETTKKVLQNFKSYTKKELMLAKKNDSSSAYWSLANIYVVKFEKRFLSFKKHSILKKEQNDLIRKQLHEFLGKALRLLLSQSGVQKEIEQKNHEMKEKIGELCAAIEDDLLSSKISFLDITYIGRADKDLGGYNLAERMGSGFYWSMVLGGGLAGGVNLIFLVGGLTIPWLWPAVGAVAAAGVLYGLIIDNRSPKEKAESLLKNLCEKEYQKILEKFYDHQKDTIENANKKSQSKSREWFQDKFIEDIEKSIQQALDDRRKAEAALSDVIGNKKAIEKEVISVRYYHHQLKKDAEQYYQAAPLMPEPKAFSEAC